MSRDLAAADTAATAAPQSPGEGDFEDDWLNAFVSDGWYKFAAADGEAYWHNPDTGETTYDEPAILSGGRAIEQQSAGADDAAEAASPPPTQAGFEVTTAKAQSPDVSVTDTEEAVVQRRFAVSVSHKYYSTFTLLAFYNTAEVIREPLREEFVGVTLVAIKLGQFSKVVVEISGKDAQTVNQCCDWLERMGRNVRWRAEKEGVKISLIPLNGRPGAQTSSVPPPLSTMLQKSTRGGGREDGDGRARGSDGGSLGHLDRNAKCTVAVKIPPMHTTGVVFGKAAIMSHDVERDTGCKVGAPKGPAGYNSSTHVQLIGKRHEVEEALFWYAEYLNILQDTQAPGPRNPGEAMLPELRAAELAAFGSDQNCEAGIRAKARPRYLVSLNDRFRRYESSRDRHPSSKVRDERQRMAREVGRFDQKRRDAFARARGDRDDRDHGQSRDQIGLWDQICEDHQRDRQRSDVGRGEYTDLGRGGRSDAQREVRLSDYLHHSRRDDSDSRRDLRSGSRDAHAPRTPEREAAAPPPIASASLLGNDKGSAVSNVTSDSLFCYAAADGETYTDDLHHLLTCNGLPLDDGTNAKFYFPQETICYPEGGTAEGDGMRYADLMARFGAVCGL